MSLIFSGLYGGAWDKASRGENMESVVFAVRTGLGSVRSDGTFSDTVEYAYRSIEPRARWQAVRYDGKRYQLHGGIRTVLFINLSNPILSRSDRAARELAYAGHFGGSR